MATGKSKGYGFVSFFNKWVSCGGDLQQMLQKKESFWSPSAAGFTFLSC